eukprot:scaffold105465_cov56-Phaeocystis_antarctica.AAC.4
MRQPLLTERILQPRGRRPQWAAAGPRQRDASDCGRQRLVVPVRWASVHSWRQAHSLSTRSVSGAVIPQHPATRPRSRDGGDQGSAF